MTATVDLHTHSTASDGTLAPEALVRLAHEGRLVGMALTDHDTVAGVPAAAAEAKRLGITFIPGIEISCSYPYPGTMHLLGYGVDPDSAVLREMARRLVEGRDNRNPRIVERLNELGMAITMDEVRAVSGGVVIGRPHIAAVMMAKGYVPTIKRAFDEYLGQGGKAYFDKERLAPKEAISLVHDSGGLAVLAHPVQLRTQNSAQLRNEIKKMADLGLDGLEVLHSDHDAAMVADFRALADEMHLLKTGGSDFHGANKPGIRLGFAGGQRVAQFYLDELQAALAARK